MSIVWKKQKAQASKTIDEENVHYGTLLNASATSELSHVSTVGVNVHMHIPPRVTRHREHPQKSQKKTSCRVVVVVSSIVLAADVAAKILKRNVSLVIIYRNVEKRHTKAS